MVIQILLALLYFAIFSWVIFRGRWFGVPGVSRKLLLGTFWIKLLFGFLFWAVYTYHYPPDHGSDAFIYFEEAKTLKAVFDEHPSDFFRLLLSINPTDPDLVAYTESMDRWNRAVSYGVINDNPTIIKFNALLLFVSLGYYHTHTLVMAFISFSGLLLIFRFFRHFSNSLPSAFLFAATFLAPSLLFWSGGVLKEGLLIFGLGLLFHSFVLLDRERFVKGGALALVAIALLLFTKTYVLIALTPGLLFFLLTRYVVSSRQLLTFFALHLGLFVFVFTLGYWVDDYNVLHMFQQKQRDFYNLGAHEQIGSLIEIPRIEHTLDIVWYTPQALFNTYFRPHLLEASSLTFLAAAAENTFYLLLLLVGIVKIEVPKGMNRTLLLTCLSFVVGLGLLIGLITPVLGAIVRYKIPALPFFLVLCGLLMPTTINNVHSYLLKRLKRQPQT